MLRSFFLVTAAAGIAFSTTAGAQTFSFETPNANYYTYNPTGYAGVTFNEKSGVATQASPFFSQTPPDGTQAAFIQSTFGAQGTVSFALTGLLAGTAYMTSFYAATRPGYATNPLTVSFNDVALGIFTPMSDTFALFTAPNFVSSGSTGMLTFTGAPTTTGDNDAIFDLVKVQPLAGPPVAGAVPEPASWALMILGMGAVGSAMRRQKTSAKVYFTA